LNKLRFIFCWRKTVPLLLSVLLLRVTIGFAADSWSWEIQFLEGTLTVCQPQADSYAECADGAEVRVLGNNAGKQPEKSGGSGAWL